MNIQRTWGNRQRSAGKMTLRQWNDSPTDNRVIKRLQTRSARLIVWSSLAVGLLGTLIHLLPYSPDKTPCFLLIETDYKVPFPINPLANEDVSLLEELDRETLSLYPTSPSWQSVAVGLGEFSKQLKLHANEVGKRGSCILYINAIGLVNDQGEPCIVPATANPHDTATWVPLHRLLESLNDNLPHHAKKLVILDCARIQADWDLGIFYNSFVERAGRLLEQGNPNTILLTSSGPGEVAWPRSNFSLHVAQGLAGLASESGGAESTVTARQLHSFVASRVQAWAVKNRGETQTPQLFVGAAGDADLAITVHPTVTRRLADRKLSALENEVLIQSTEIADLWKMLAEIKTTPLMRLDPIRFRNLQHKLLRLEQLRSAGPALTLMTSQDYESLKTELELLSRADWSNLTQQWKSLGWHQPHFMALFRPHSIDLAQAMGNITPVDSETLRTSVDEAIRESRIDHIKLPESRDELRGYAELQFLQISAAADTYRQWPKSNPMSSVASLRAQGNRYAAGLTTGALDDPRIHTLLRSQISKALDAIRAAEDTLWNTQSAEQLQRQLDLARRQLANVEEKHSLLTQSLRIADIANGDLPYFGQWLGDPWMLSINNATNIDLNRSKRMLIELADGVARLNLQLSGLDGDDEALNAISNAAKAVETRHSDLQAEVYSLADALIDQVEAVPGRWRQMNALLATPLIDGERRQKLTRRFDDIRREMLTNYEQSSDFPDLQDILTVDQRNEKILQTLDWAPQLACSIAAPNQDRLNVSVLASVGKTDEIAETVNKRMRRHLFECASLANVTSNPSDMLDDTDLKSSSDYRTSIRSAVSFWYATDDLNVYQYQHSKNVREHLLWLANEALRDSWGGQWLDSKNQPGNEPYFAAVAEDYLNAAESIALPLPIVEDDTQGIRERLAKQRMAVVGGIAATAKDGSLTPGLGFIHVDATLSPVVPDIQFAPGIASIFVRSSYGQRFNVMSADASTNINTPLISPQVQLPLDERFKPSFSIMIDRSADLEGRVNLVTFFRGLEMLAPFNIITGQGARYSYEPQEYGNATVTLTGEGRQQSSILFVLDCSASMADPVPSERAGFDQQSKLEIAKSYLAGMLDELARDGTARVGLISFGHRMGWSKSAPVKLLIQPRYVLPIPETISPSNDIETLLSLGRFDSTEAAKLGYRLDDLVPWGQSPVYSSILEALESFNLESAEADKSIVVVTDGVNYQFTPPDRMIVNSSPTSLAGVVKKVKEMAIPVHVLGFGVEQDDRMETQVAFEQIAKASGGSYRLASNGRELLSLLNSRLGAGSYSLDFDTASNSPENASVNYRLNDTVQVPTKRGPPIKARIAFRDAAETLELYDGQWLQLQATQRPQIKSVPYEAGSPVAIPLVAENNRETGHVFRVQRPINRHGRLDLTVSMQAQHKSYTNRPSEVWLEVTPVGENARTYHFYDAHFQPFEPVPVLKWTAENWPRDSRSARVRFWCKNETTRPVKTVLVSDLLQSDLDFSPDEPVPGIKGVTYRIEIDKNLASPTQVMLRVLEIHDVSSSAMSPVRIDLTNSGNILTKVERYIDTVNGVGQHVFHLDLARQVNPSDLKALLTFTLADAAKSQAWRLQDELLDVEIGDLNALLPIAMQ